VYVLLDTDQTRPASDQSTDQALIVARLENEVQFLREELARRDAIMLNMTEAMKALSPPADGVVPQEPPQAPETATEQPGRVGPQPAVEGPREPVRRRVRSWWKARFGSAMVGMLTAFAVLAANGENPLDPFHTGDEGQQARVPLASEPAPPPEPAPIAPLPEPEPAPEPTPTDPVPTGPGPSPTDPVTK
jgi:hypothetical protein